MGKVLFVNLRLTAGGSERVMSLLANAFAEHGIETEMIILKDEPHTYPVNPKIKITECFCERKGSNILWHIKRILKLRTAIKGSKASTVISFMWDINMNVLCASVGLRKHVIVSERADPSHEPRKRALSFAMKYILPMADVTVFQTPEVQLMYPKSIQHRSVVIPNPISDKMPEPFTGIRRKAIVAAGRFNEQKNFPMLIRAFAKFFDTHPEYRLEIFGEGALREKYLTEIKELGIEDVVSLPGYVDDVNSRMQDASIYVSSSNYEGISNAMLEALAMGLPCICTDCPVGGASMVIKDGVNGLLVPVNGEEELVVALNKIADSETLSRELSKQAVIMSQEYSLNRIFEKWRELCV